MKGISLLESVIYVALLAVIFVVVVNSSVVTLRAFSEARVRRVVIEEGGSAIERMAREIRLASAVDEGASTLDAHPGELALATVVSASDDTDVTRRFYLEDGALMMEDQNAARPLTADATVTEFVVRLLEAGETSQAVRIELSLEAAQGRHTAEEDYAMTTVLRRSY